MSVRVFFSLACLMMASGVGVAALAAHAGAGRELATASSLLLANAPMLGAASIAFPSRYLRPVTGRLGWVVAFVGTVLFSADMMSRGLGYGAIFPDAAPIGGSMDIVGWLVVALSVIFRRN